MDYGMPGSPDLHYLWVCSNPCPLSQWCFLTISPFATPFSFCLHSFPASGSFSMSQLFTLGGQSIRASATVLPMNIWDWFPFGLTGLISCIQGTLKNLLQHHSSKASILQHSAFFMVQLSHPYMTTGKTIVLTRPLLINWYLLLFNMLSRFIIAFLPRSKHLLISRQQSLSTVILEPKKIKFVTVSIFPHLFARKGPDAMISVFLMLNFKPFFTLLFHPHQEALLFLFTFGQ